MMRSTLCIATLLLAACTDAAGPRVVASVEVTPRAAAAWVGDTLVLAATARDGSGRALPGRSLTWETSAASVAYVDATGRVIAQGTGTAIVRASADGVTGACTVTVALPELLVEGDAGGGPELFRLPPQGGVPARLLPAGTVVMDPVASPDGSRIAFVVADYDDATGDIWVVHRDGTGLERLTDHGAMDDAPAWSPDGTRLAFRTYRSELLGEIWVMQEDGTGLVNLTPKVGMGAIDHHRPAWSPDGSRIAYASTAGGDWSIWTMKADGSDRRQLTNTDDFDTEPTWSPDGQWIAFRRSSPGVGSDIMIVPAVGGEAVRIALPGHERQPAWSPDGRLLAFARQATLSDPPEVFTIRPDGSDVTQRTWAATWGAASNPSWARVP
jgi:Tol biopolymer transport system component